MSHVLEPLPGFRHLPARLTPAQQVDLLAELLALVETAGWFQPTMPRSGRERDGRISRISLATVSRSPGRTGRGQASSPLVSMVLPASVSKLEGVLGLLGAAVGVPLHHIEGAVEGRGVERAGHQHGLLGHDDPRDLGRGRGHR